MALLWGQVRAVASGPGSADALRAVAGSLVADAVAVLSADLVSDVPLGAVLAAHTVRLGDLVLHTAATCCRRTRCPICRWACFVSSAHTLDAVIGNVGCSMLLGSGRDGKHRHVFQKKGC